jgi:zinc transporter ZupT
MMKSATILFYGLLVALGNVAGGWLLARNGARTRNPKILSYLIALGAGFMLAAVFIEVLPETFDLWTRKAANGGSGIAVAMSLLLAGYLLIHLFEHTVAPHFHFGAETHTEAMLKPKAAYTAIVGLSIHTFFDGVSVAAAFEVNFRVGFLVFLAILLHKLPEGFTAASIVLASGRSLRSARAATLIVGAATLAGVFAIVLLQAQMEQASFYALPFGAGVTLYVAASDLIPEVNHVEHKNPRISIIVFAGVALFYILHSLIEK